MLRITVPETEFFLDNENSFVQMEAVTIVLEHSLVSMSKWESNFEKPFLTSANKTEDEIYNYVECMIVNGKLPDNLQQRLSFENLKEINHYIDSKQTATTFGQMPKRGGANETVTSELIYYWLVAFNIPFECQHWHLNRLFALIRVCNIKAQPPKKMSRSEVAQRNRDINAKRRAELGTPG